MTRSYKLVTVFSCGIDSYLILQINHRFETHVFNYLEFLNSNLLTQNLLVHNFLMMMMKMMNCFCGMVDRRKAFSLISSRDHCQRSSSSRICDTPRAGFDLAQNLSSGLVE